MATNTLKDSMLSFDDTITEDITTEDQEVLYDCD